jgi:cGMP-dependent protein kinase
LKKTLLLHRKNSTNYLKFRLKDDLIASPDCLIASCDLEVFSKIVEGSIQKKLIRTTLLDSLKTVPIFKNFSENKLLNLLDIVKVEKFNNAEKIVKQGEISNKFYIIKSGKVDIYVKNEYVRTLNPEEYFGEKALFYKEARSASAQANGIVETFTITQNDLEKIVEPSMQSYIISRIHLTDNVELTDLIYHKDLGFGNYGTVSLVKSKTNKCFYAIKTINRQKIDYEDLHSNLTLERSILLQIEHPFIVKLVRCLRDKENVYYLMEYIKGKELFDIIHEIGLLNKSQAMFYGASIMLAINYLHNRQFIFRDIKPENIMVTENVSFY